MADELNAHEYKIAPIGGRARVSIGSDKVTVANAKTGRIGKTFSLHGVKGGRWSETGMRYGGVPTLVARALVLKGEGTLNLHRGGKPADDKSANSAGFYAACASVLRAANALNPELRIDIGSSGYVRWLMAIFGVVAVLLGLVMLLAAGSGLLTGEWWTGFLFLALSLSLGGSGLSMALSFNPLRKQTSISAADLAADLEARAAGAGER